MSFNYDQREVFNHIHLAKDENANPEETPRWGYICDSCGRDSRVTYGGTKAILSCELADITEAWYHHLVNSHGISFPKPLCSFTVYIGITGDTMRCVAGEEGHEGKHKFEL